MIRYIVLFIFVVVYGVLGKRQAIGKNGFLLQELKSLD